VLPFAGFRLQTFSLSLSLSLQERNTEKERGRVLLKVVLLDEHRKIVGMKFVMRGMNRMLLIPH